MDVYCCSFLRGDQADRAEILIPYRCHHRLQNADELVYSIKIPHKPNQ